MNEGGHDIPEEDVRRRYERGLINFFNLYEPIVDNWLFIDNTGEMFQIVAEGTPAETAITDQIIWNQLQYTYHEE